MRKRSSRRAIEILLIEDNVGDARLTQEVFQECNVRNNIRVARDGKQAMACLHREGPYAAMARPDLILLDLNLPKKDGFAVLAEIKNDPDLRRIPVLVLTSSSAELDIRKSYDLHANCYLIKPGGLDEFVELVRSIESFWLLRVNVPNWGA